MSLSRESREVKRAKAYLRFHRKLDTIDWEEDVFLPAIEAIKSGRHRFDLELSGNAVSELVSGPDIRDEAEVAS